MRTRLTLQPHQHGAKQLLAQYGDRLVRVRYRYDEPQKKRIKTVELIVEKSVWEPLPYPQSARGEVGSAFGKETCDGASRMRGENGIRSAASGHCATAKS